MTFNRSSKEECTLLEDRIIKICKQSNIHFSFIDTEQITKNLNFTFKTKYTTEDVAYILGFIYEKEFNYQNIDITADVLQF